MNNKSSTIFSILVLALLHISGAQEGTPCTTPSQESGVCVNIRSCDRLVRLLRTQISNPEVRSYLQRSTCGFIGSNPIVCCPLLRNPNPNTTPEPTSTANTDLPKTSENIITPIPTTSSPDTPKSSDLSSGLLRPPQCGYSNITNGRVVGGIPAKLGEFPWIVVLGYKNSKNPDQPKWLCGGSLISERHVLTAGHCVNNRPDLYLARLGELDLYGNDDGANPVTIPLVNAKVHEDYNPTTYTSDIAVLTLAYKPNVPGVWPICLPVDEPLKSQKFVKYLPFVAGWGSLNFNGPSSAVLQVVQLPVVTNEQCKQAFTNFKTTIIDDRVLCAGYVRGGKDACQGDSGGPLMLARTEPTNARFFQIGVVSYGFRCAEAGFPGVYTRTTAYLEWIQNNIK